MNLKVKYLYLAHIPTWEWLQEEIDISPLGSGWNQDFPPPLLV